MRERRGGRHEFGRGAPIGAGTGAATRRLLDLGAEPLIAVEPDARLADFLRMNNPDRALKIRVSTFEDVELEEAAFDLGISATAFHWLEEDARRRHIVDMETGELFRVEQLR